MEIKALTGIRGVFAFYVVIFHLVPHEYGEGINNFITNGYLAVDFFFLLSGFIMSMVHHEFSVKGGGNYVHFMYKRFCRIYPLYIFLYILTSFIVFLHSGTYYNPVVALINLSLLQSIFGFNYIQSSWSISTELFAYLLFPVILNIISNSRYIIPAVLLAIASLLYLSINNNVLALSLGIAGGWQSILRCLADYTLGITSFVLLRKGIIVSKPVSYILGCIVIFFLFHRTFDIYVVILCAVLIPAVADCKNVMSKIFAIRPIHYLGEISYSFYLIHSIFINQLGFMFEGLAYYKSAIIIASLIASCVTYHTVEKPCRAYLSSGKMAFFKKAKTDA